MRLTWVVPRYGAGVVGGAETLVRRLASRAAPAGWSVEVATTRASDHRTWDDDLPAGTSVEEGVRVRRFGVSPRSQARYDELHPVVLAGEPSYVDELEWLSNSVWSEGLERWLEASPHDLAVFCPYLFGTTLWGVHADPARAAVMPCVHDEPYARLATVRAALSGARGCIYNSPGEERLAARLYRVRDGGVVGMGFDPPAGPPPRGFARAHGLEGDFLLYAGRLEEGKRVDVLVDHAVRHARERPDAPRLVLIGSGGYRVPHDARDVVVEAGYVSEQDKRAAFAEALALVNPSELESLSIVLMEAWLEGTPAIVARGSEVMAEHCELSGGGVAFGSYAEYRDAVDGIRAEPAVAAAMGRRGREYVLDVYGWPAVRRRFAELVARLAP